MLSILFAKKEDYALCAEFDAHISYEEFLYKYMNAAIISCAKDFGPLAYCAMPCFGIVFPA